VGIVAGDAVLARMSAAEGSRPAHKIEAWSTETFVRDEDEVFFNGEVVEMWHF
jgi:hypothetical protein